MSLIFTGSLTTYYVGGFSLVAHQMRFWSLADATVHHLNLHCLPLIYSSSPFPFPLQLSLLFCMCRGAGRAETQWDMTGGNKDGSKAVGFCVVKSAAKSTAYPSAT